MSSEVIKYPSNSLNPRDLCHRCYEILGMQNKMKATLHEHVQEFSVAVSINFGRRSQRYVTLSKTVVET
jgi:hypothetical protein